MSPFEERRYVRLHSNGWQSEVILTDEDSCGAYVTTADGERRRIVSECDAAAGRESADRYVLVYGGHVCDARCEEWPEG